MEQNVNVLITPPEAVVKVLLLRKSHNRCNLDQIGSNFTTKVPQKHNYYILSDSTALFRLT